MQTHKKYIAIERCMDIKMVHIRLLDKTNKGFGWYHINNTYACGYAYLNGAYLEGQALCKYLDETIDKDDFIKKASHLNGIFSAITSTDKVAVAIVDRYGVYKLFYRQDNHEFYIGDNAYEMAFKVGRVELNKESVKDFVYAGFSAKNETLVKSVKSLNASKLLKYDSENGVDISRYHKFNQLPSMDKYDILKAQLLKISREVSKKLVKSLDGQTAVVPLSGGVDSRFCLMLLKEAGYKKVLCLTYGRKKGKEEIVAQNAAKAYGYKNIMIPHKKSYWKRFFKEKSTIDYIDYASGLKAVPHYSDLYAAKYLSQMPGCEDFVIIPGHIGSIADSIMEPGKLYSKDDFLNQLIKKYFYFYGFKHKKIIDYLKSRLEEYFTEEGAIDSKRAEELFDTAAYDTYRSNHLMMALKPYEFYGFKWRIPLMDKELVNFFKTVPLEYRKKDKILLSEVVLDYMSDSTGFYKPPQTYIGKVILNLRDRRYSCIKPFDVFKLNKTEYNLPGIPRVIYRYYRNYLSYASAKTLEYLLDRIEDEEN